MPLAIAGPAPAFPTPTGPDRSVDATRFRPSMTSQSAPDATASTDKPQSPQQHEMPLAMVHGQPVLQIPQDLYIPPDALEVILDAFEGPLDLLLYLIRRQNLDILTSRCWRSPASTWITSTSCRSCASSWRPNTW